MFRPLLPRGGDLTTARFRRIKTQGCLRNQIALIRVWHAAFTTELSRYVDA